MHLHVIISGFVLHSLGFEIIEDIREPDIVLTCCGGGGNLAGIASALKLSGTNSCKVYGVEPEGGMKNVPSKFPL